MTISTQAVITFGFHRNADHSQTKIGVSRVRQVAVVSMLFKATKWIFDPYRPELHYMRGPGPKWREKNLRQRPV